MAFTYAFTMPVTTQVRVYIESETELSNAEAVAKAIQSPSDCDYDGDELDWDDIKFAFENLTGTEKEAVEASVEVTEG
jgi:hypothetical protein